MLVTNLRFIIKSQFEARLDDVIGSESGIDA